MMARRGGHPPAISWRILDGTVLTAGACADGEVLTRSGTTLIGSAGGGACADGEVLTRSGTTLIGSAGGGGGGAPTGASYVVLGNDATLTSERVATAGTGITLTDAGANSTLTLAIDTAWVGQAAITTLGTITTGVWNGTAISAPRGGTGQSSYTTGDLLYASGTSALTTLAAGTSGYVLTSGGAGVAPSWAAAAGGASPYTPPVASDFTTNVTPAGASITDGSQGLILTAAGDTAAYNVVQALQAKPASTWTRYWKMALPPYQKTYQMAGWMVKESSTGKFITIGFTQDATTTTGAYIQYQSFNSATSRNGFTTVTSYVDPAGVYSFAYDATDFVLSASATGEASTFQEVWRLSATSWLATFDLVGCIRTMTAALQAPVAPGASRTATTQRTASSLQATTPNTRN